MNTLISFAAALLLAILPGKSLFNTGWEFQLEGAASWQKVELPHDWSVQGQIDKANPMGNDGGYFPAGKGYYRKTFTMTPELSGKLVSLYFEGSYMDTEVRVNGQLAGGHNYGYSSFSVDISSFLHSGDNLIEVSVDNSKQKNCRWYSGSGIYRQLWLIVTDALHFDQWGTAITSSNITAANADVNLTTSITNSSLRDRTVRLEARISNETRNNSKSQELTIKAGETRTVSIDLPMAKPALWSPDTPFLYNAELTLTEDGKLIDSYTDEFGIRSIQYTADRGFLLNGKPLNLFGGCVHHDNGILGAAAFPRAEEKRVRALKEAGFNAVRTSHNPPSEAFLKACDHMGIMVIDEAFDGWRDAKNDNDYHLLFDEHWQDDLGRMILRDRNHPSIICWSIGNEVIEREKLEFYSTTKKLSEYCRSIDPTRPVTQALATWNREWQIYDPICDLHEVNGYNYVRFMIARDHERDPKRIIWQTETYPRDAFKNWEVLNDNPYVIGDFVWTAIDYLGESSIGRWYYDGDNPGEHYDGDQYPWHGAYCGDIDLTFWRKPISHYRQILFAPEFAEPVAMGVLEPDNYFGKIHLTRWSVWPAWESWNWEGWEGKPITVEVYTRKHAVKLYLDGKLVGEQEVSRATEFKASFTIDYHPGTLTAVACDADGNQLGKVSYTTAGKPAAIRLKADRTSISADGQDLSFVTVEVVDSKGNVCPNAQTQLKFDVKGNGSLAAAGNANLQIDDSYTDSIHPSWKGRAMAIVRSDHKAGNISLTVSGEGLKPASIKIITK